MYIASLLAILLVCHLTSAAVSPFSTTTYAGTPTSFTGNDGFATSAILKSPQGVWGDSAGNFFFVDASSYQIKMISSYAKILTVIVGTGVNSASSDNLRGTSTGLSSMKDVCGDSSGNIYYTDSSFYTGIRKWNATSSIISKVVGGGTANVDNIAGTSSSLSGVFGLFVDSVANVYVSDAPYNKIRKVTAVSGLITTFAGSSGGSVYNAAADNVAATNAYLYYPYDVWGDSNTGHFYITDCYNHRIRKVASSGILDTFAGVGTGALSGDDGPATSAQMLYPYLLYGDINTVSFTMSAHVVRQIQLTGFRSISRVAGLASNSNGYTGDGGQASAAALYTPIGVFADSTGLYFTETTNNVVRRRAPDGTLSTIAGQGPSNFGDGSVGTAATFKQPLGMWMSSTNALYVADTLHYKVRVVAANGASVLTVAGSGNFGYSTSSGPATSADLATPVSVWRTSSGVLYVGEQNTYIVRRIDTNQIITVFAGMGSYGAAANSVMATATYLTQPFALAGNTAGEVFIADYNTCKIRKVDGSGLMTVVAGRTADDGCSDSNNVPAVGNYMYQPRGLWVDSANNMYIAEISGQFVRFVSFATGIMTKIAGGGGALVNGPATSVYLGQPYQLWVDSSAQSLYVVVDNYCVVRRLDLSSGYMSTVAGSACASTITNNDDALLATFYTPQGIAGDSAGNLYVSETNSYYVRKLAMRQQLPSSQPTAQPSRQPSSQPSRQPSSQPSRQPTIQPSGQPSSQPSRQPATQPSSQPSARPSSQPSRQPTAQPSIQPSAQPSSQPSRSPSTQPSSQPSRQPSSQPSVQPSSQPSSSPSCQPTVQPSAQPSTQPSAQPSTQPSCSPTVQPSAQPSRQPSSQPSARPSTQPSSQPSRQPSSQPSDKPSSQPSASPTMQPSSKPSNQPSSQPTTQPTRRPSSQPSMQLIASPSAQPSLTPSSQPSVQPTSQPSSEPSGTPSTQPSCSPSCHPTSQPSVPPTQQPTSVPSNQPSGIPSTQPTSAPSTDPSSQPSACPSNRPSSQPTSRPSYQPSALPSQQPLSAPSTQPSTLPTSQPTSCPSAQPSLQPFGHPSRQPSSLPSQAPSASPSLQPMSRPSSQPSARPSTQPSMQPSIQPTAQPSSIPSMRPSSQPSGQPSKQPVEDHRFPTSQPISSPSSQPTAQPQSEPSQSPTYLTRGTFPRSGGVSVLGVNSTSFKVVLPFQFAAMVPGDGFADIVLSSPPSKGTNYFVYGGVTAFQSGVSLGGLTAAQGHYTYPAVSYDFSGRSVSVVGDINGDGLLDLVVGVPYVSSCYVLFGTPLGFTDMRKGFSIYGTHTTDQTGWSVSGAGDVNNDGFADIIIGAPQTVAGGLFQSGAAYVLFGKRHSFANIDLGNLSPADGFALLGGSVSDCSGISVSSAGDVNGDGFDDVLVGAARMNTLFCGATFVVFGGPTHLLTTVFLGNMTSAKGFAVTGGAWSHSGFSVSGAGDVNRDGFADVLVASVPKKGNSYSTQISYLIFGKASGHNNFALNTMSPQQGVAISGGGVMVSGVGDVNGDGIDDIMVGTGYGFVSVGGYVLPTAGSAARSFAPTPAPSTRTPTAQPTSQPSARPSRQPTIAPSSSPTSPTSAPSPAPTDPTSVPSSAPSNPTRDPTLNPTAPTCAPTESPSQVPSARPTYLRTMPPTPAPSTRPSFEPSLAPSMRPSTSPSEWPTKIPSESPSKSAQRTRFPTLSSKPSGAVASSLPSTSTPDNYSRTVHTSEQSDWRRTLDNIHFVVNSTKDVRVTGIGGKDKFTLLRRSHTVLTVEHFNAQYDVIDLLAFPALRSLSDLNITRGSVVITLQHNQTVRLLNLNPEDVGEENFEFAPVVDEKDETLITRINAVLTAAVGVAVVLGALWAVRWLLKTKVNAVKLDAQVLLLDEATRLTFYEDVNGTVDVEQRHDASLHVVTPRNERDSSRSSGASSSCVDSISSDENREEDEEDKGENPELEEDWSSVSSDDVSGPNQESKIGERPYDSSATSGHFSRSSATQPPSRSYKSSLPSSSRSGGNTPQHASVGRSRLPSSEVDSVGTVSGSDSDLSRSPPSPAAAKEYGDGRTPKSTAAEKNETERAVTTDVDLTPAVQSANKLMASPTSLPPTQRLGRTGFPEPGVGASTSTPSRAAALKSSPRAAGRKQLLSRLNGGDKLNSRKEALSTLVRVSAAEEKNRGGGGGATEVKVRDEESSVSSSSGDSSSEND